MWPKEEVVSSLFILRLILNPREFFDGRVREKTSRITQQFLTGKWKAERAMY